jgi:hypothetical protein
MVNLPRGVGKSSANYWEVESTPELKIPVRNRGDKLSEPLRPKSRVRVVRDVEGRA